MSYTLEQLEKGLENARKAGDSDAQDRFMRAIHAKSNPEWFSKSKETYKNAGFYRDPSESEQQENEAPLEITKPSPKAYTMEQLISGRKKAAEAGDFEAVTRFTNTINKQKRDEAEAPQPEQEQGWFDYLTSGKPLSSAYYNTADFIHTGIGNVGRDYYRHWKGHENPTQAMEDFEITGTPFDLFDYDHDKRRDYTRQQLEALPKGLWTDFGEVVSDAFTTAASGPSRVMQGARRFVPFLQGVVNQAGQKDYDSLLSGEYAQDAAFTGTVNQFADVVARDALPLAAEKVKPFIDDTVKPFIDDLTSSFATKYGTKTVGEASASTDSQLADAAARLKAADEAGDSKAYDSINNELLDLPKQFDKAGNEIAPSEKVTVKQAMADRTFFEFVSMVNKRNGSVTGEQAAEILGNKGRLRDLGFAPKQDESPNKFFTAMRTGQLSEYFSTTGKDQIFSDASLNEGISDYLETMKSTIRSIDKPEVQDNFKYLEGIARNIEQGNDDYVKSAVAELNERVKSLRKAGHHDLATRTKDAVNAMDTFANARGKLMPKAEDGAVSKAIKVAKDNPLLSGVGASIAASLMGTGGAMVLGSAMLIGMAGRKVASKQGSKIMANKQMDKLAQSAAADTTNKFVPVEEAAESVPYSGYTTTNPQHDRTLFAEGQTPAPNGYVLTEGVATRPYYAQPGEIPTNQFERDFWMDTQRNKGHDLVVNPDGEDILLRTPEHRAEDVYRMGYNPETGFEYRTHNVYSKDDQGNKKALSKKQAGKGDKRSYVQTPQPAFYRADANGNMPPIDWEMERKLNRPVMIDGMPLDDLPGYFGRRITTWDKNGKRITKEVIVPEYMRGKPIDKYAPPSFDFIQGTKDALVDARSTIAGQAGATEEGDDD